ncbi:MAG: (d)CMP kinase [Eubacteriales bacterium]|nr:(d)CMP kinase [Eubacteriales bacterium]MDD4327262.1 (d)CMP kinase [Eubacteriales bacterium]MDD4716858.1 (d)CMP kinase [Eubacteriales bacterium]
MPYSIAVDGPAGAGKSTIARKIAELKALVYIDTGAMYRACALKAIRLGISCSDAVSVEKMMEDINIDFKGSDTNSIDRNIFLDGEDVSSLIRTPDVSKGASDISALSSVRIRMVELQRKMAEGYNVILDGRDIGTFVLPNADLKIFLTASADERARRRLDEMRAKGDMISDFEDVKRDIEYRDHNDSNRSLAPLRKAEDAVEIDTTRMSIEQVVEAVCKLIVIKC